MKYLLKQPLALSKVLLLSATMLTVSTPILAGDDDDNNIVRSIVSAPVVTNGIVGGEPSELNIYLDADDAEDDTAFDPENFGHQIPAGGRLEIELSGSYVRNLDENGDPVQLFNNRSLVITTGPQNGISAAPGVTPANGNWNVTVDENNPNLLFVTPVAGNGRNGLEGERAREIGIKAIHLRPDTTNRSVSGTSFFNGPAGTVGSIAVRIVDRRGRVREEGYADVVFEASVGRQVHLTNGGLTTRGAPPETVEVIDFERVAPNTVVSNTVRPAGGLFSDGLPYAPRFSLFEALEVGGRSFIPQPGIENVGYVVDANNPALATLTENGSPIGNIIITGPSVDSRGAILPSNAFTTIGGNGSILSVPVRVGSEEGLYTITMSFNGGGSVSSHIVVDEDDDDGDDDRDDD